MAMRRLHRLGPEVASRENPDVRRDCGPLGGCHAGLLYPMKTIRSFVIVAMLSAPALLSAAPFEGKVSFKMTSARGQPQEMSYSIKGDKMRLEVPSQAAAGMGGVIFDVPKREVTIVMDSQQ